MNFEKYVYTSTFYGTTLLLIPNQEPHLLFHYYQEILLVMGSISFSLLEILGHKRRGIVYISLKENLILEKKKHNFAIIACHLWNFHH